MKKKIALTVQLDNDVLAKCQVICGFMNISMDQLVNHVLAKYVKEQKVDDVVRELFTHIKETQENK